MSSRRAPVLVLALGLVGSQAGHLLAYEARFGPAAARIQSSGAHAYFPAAAKTGLGVAAALLLAGLFVVGLARLAAGRPLRREAVGPSFLSVLAALFTIQLACFAAQEAAEAYLAGAAPSSPAVLLLWGTLGQLPVALLSALAIRWLLSRFAAAIAEVRLVATQAPPPRGLLPALVAVRTDANQSDLLSRVAGRSLTKRGPPLLPRPSCN